MNDELKEKMLEKMEDGALTPEDIPDYMTLFVEVCNDNEEIQEEVEGWDRLFQMAIDGADDLWLKIADCKFSKGAGKTDGEVDITLEMNADTAVGIFSGDIDATSAYLNKDLNVIGPLPDAVKFRTLTELVREELED